MHPSWSLPVVAASLVAASASLAQPVPPAVLWSQPAGARTVAFSPNGRYVASGGLQSRNPFSFGRVDVWDAADGSSLGHAETHGPGLIGYTGDVAFSPDGATLASANGTGYCGPNGGCSPDRPGLFTWSVPTLAPLAGRTDLSPASAVSYAPDGSSLAVSYFHDNAGRVRTHDPATLATVLDLPGHRYAAHDVAWSPDRSLIASVGDDDSLRLWDATTGALVRAMFHGDYAQGGDPISVSFSPDGRLVATSGSGYALRARVWRVADGSLVHDLDAGISPSSYGTAVIAFTPNGAYLAGGLEQYVPGDEWRGRVRFWNVTTGAVVLEYAESGPAPQFGGVTSLAFSRAQDDLFAYTVAGAVKVVRTPIKMATPTASVPPAASAFHLGAAFPNPFSGRTELRLLVTRSQRVRAEVFDALGRRVAGLLDGRLEAGRPHTLSLAGAHLPSGRYVIRLRGEDFAATREVALTR